MRGIKAPTVDAGGIEVKTAVEVEALRKACELASRVRALAGTVVEVGRTTDDIDKVVHDALITANAYPSPLGTLCHF